MYFADSKQYLHSHNNVNFFFMFPIAESTHRKSKDLFFFTYSCYQPSNSSINVKKCMMAKVSCYQPSNSKVDVKKYMVANVRRWTCARKVEDVWGH